MKKTPKHLTIAGLVLLSLCTSKLAQAETIPTQQVTALNNANPLQEKPNQQELLSEAETKAEMIALEGKWMVTSLIAGGAPAPDDYISGIHWQFLKDKVSMSGKESDFKNYELGLKNTPKEINFYGAPKGEYAKGIYEIEGDTLKVSFSQSTRAERPLSFDTNDTKYLLFTFKRAEQ